MNFATLVQKRWNDCYALLFERKPASGALLSYGLCANKYFTLKTWTSLQASSGPQARGL
jgi:hypothetical protein